MNSSTTWKSHPGVEGRKWSWRRYSESQRNDDETDDETAGKSGTERKSDGIRRQ
jgi:hypothetical protein